MERKQHVFWYWAAAVVLTLGSTAAAGLPGLVGHWTFDEGQGATAFDSSGHSLHGTLRGNPTWTTGQLGGALDFNGTTAYVEIPDNPLLALTSEITIAAWTNMRTTSSGEMAILSKGSWAVNDLPYELTEQRGGVIFWQFYNDAGRDTCSPNAPAAGEWHHIAATYDGRSFKCYIDGKLEEEWAYAGAMPKNTSPVTIGRRSGGGTFFNGKIDDVQLWARALPVAEINKIMTGLADPSLAQEPSPEDQAVDVPRDAVLSWKAGETAATHDVYLGTTFADVNTASRTTAKGVLASQGQAGTIFDPPGALAYGQTYYWRIDEVNKAPDNTIFKGEVWSFTTEPYGYPVKPVAAKASSAQTGMGPEKTIDGSGLTGDLHGTEPTTMWMSTGAQPNWIQYEFDKAYKLHQLLVWNSNQLVESFLGFGAKKVTVETSADGTTWKPVANVPEFSRASGLPGYAANTVVNFGGVEAKFVKLTINTNWGGIAPQAGLAEVRFTYVPVQARVPQPANAAKDVSVDASLAWRPGREAVSHKVFFGTDQPAVAGGTAPAKTATEHSYTPGVLNLATTYYWRVDEVNAAVTYPGEVWSFTTQAHTVVDDFESYSDKAGEEVFSTWIDGFADNYRSSGSTVGLDTAAAGTFCETTIIHGGRQAMPLRYDNTKASISEATMTFDSPQDWTASGIKSLSLWFQGVAGNGGQLYVKIDGTKVSYDGDAADLAKTAWQVWNIDLSKAGKVNGVRSLAIGIEGAGAKGTLYVDDIRLYPKVPEYIVPVQPVATGLVAYYTFDEGSGTTAKDTSGKGNNGTIAGGTSWVAGTKGGALQLSGSGYVVIDGVAKSMPADNNFTVGAWIKTTTTSQGYVIASNDNASGHDFTLGTATNGNLFVQANTAHNYPPKINDNQWHLITYVRDGTTAYLYTDGVLVGTETPSGNPATQVRWSIGQEWDGATGPASDFYTGAVDDVRIYARPLSASEVAGLAGLTKSMAKAF